MRHELNLSELAKAVGMSPSDLATELRRGNVPGVAASTGKPGKARFFTLQECVYVAIFAALRRLSANNRILGLRAKYAAPQAAQVLGQILSQQPPTGMGLAIIPRSDGDETRGLVRNTQDLAALVTYAFHVGDPVQVLPFAPIFQRLMFALAEANGVTPEEMAKVPLAAAAPGATMPGATATGPDTTDARGRTKFSRVRAAEGSDATGLWCSASDGLQLFLNGDGVRLSMTADLWRELSTRASAIANEIERSSRGLESVASPSDPAGGDIREGAGVPTPAPPLDRPAAHDHG